ncbi:MAG: aegerolysin family protein [Kofleriaceae bacterium]
MPSPQNAARSTIVKITNNSSATLFLGSATLSHGIWSDNMYPPQQIQPGASIQFASESQGFMTGTEGNALYTAIVLTDTSKNGSMSLHWDNPYAGSNAYGHSEPWFLNVSTSGGSGNNATWVVTITNK